MVITAGIARPYSRAIFKIALESGEFQQWSDILQALEMVTIDAQMVAVIESPKIDREELAQVVVEACATVVSLTEQSKNLIKILTNFDRLNVISEIRSLYEDLRAEQEKTITVQVISASALTDSQQEKFIKALILKLDRKVTVECEIDETLLGGAILRAGDLVIDGSMTGKLKKLASQLSC